MKATLYDALGISPTSSDEEVRAALRSAIVRGGEWLSDAIENERWQTPAPIGFYFAKLWYYERLYPLIFTVAALAKARWALGED